MEELVQSLIELSGLAGLETYSYRPVDVSSDVLKKFTNSRSAGTLTLVLGAGVSRGSGVQDWNGLISRAAAELFGGTAIPNAPKTLKGLGLSSLVEVRFIETCVELRTAFRSILARVLYEHVDLTVRNETLDALCEVILGLDGRRPVRSVITYNFDDLLEIRLRELAAANGISTKIRSIYSHETYVDAAESDCIRIYHPHGFLPYGVKIEELGQLPIVFSEEDFHRYYLDFHYWGNLIQLDAFSRANCLLVGLSFSDANMRRLLDFVRFRENLPSERHAIITRRYSKRKGRDNFLKEYVRELDFKSLRVAPIWIQSFAEIATVIRKI